MADMPRLTIRKYAHNEYGQVWTGPGVAAVRAQVRREQDAALILGDETGDYSVLRGMGSVEDEVGRRLGRVGDADRAGGPDGPEPLRVSAEGAHPSRKRRAA